MSKTITYFIFLSFLTVFAGCDKKDDSSKPAANNNDNDTKGYDVVAHLEFSSGKSMDFKANSVIPFPEPFINDENNGERILTSGYQVTIDNLIYRLDIKAVFKEEAGSYTMYTNSSDQLENLGFYMEFTIQDKNGASTVNDLYRTQYVSGESGNFEITSVTKKRLKGTFTANLPYMPLEKGKNVKLTNGKIDIAIQWMDE